MAQVEADGVQRAGPPLTITNSFEHRIWNCDAGMPVDRSGVELEGEVKPGMSPSGKALRFVHFGPHDRLAALAPRIDAWIAVHGYTLRDRPIDQYVNAPREVPESELVTHLVYPVD
jgi:effector-binding domain-containing protein